MTYFYSLQSKQQKHISHKIILCLHSETLIPGFKKEGLHSQTFLMGIKSIANQTSDLVKSH